MRRQPPREVCQVRHGQQAQNFLPIRQNCDPLTRTSAKGAKAACADVAGCWLRNGLELDHLRSGKCDAQHLGPEVHEHCRIAVLGADHATEAVPIMADSIAYGVARHYSDGWRLVEGTPWEGSRGAGAARSHAASVRPLGRAGAPLPEVNARATSPALGPWFAPLRSDDRRDRGCSNGSHTGGVSAGSGIEHPGRSNRRTRPRCL